jgi:hypothetical protein
VSMIHGVVVGKFMMFVCASKRKFVFFTWKNLLFSREKLFHLFQ